MLLTDGIVKRGVKSGWSYTIRVNDEAIAEGSSAVEITTTSILMKAKAITETLRYLQAKQYRRAIIVTDSMSTLQKISKENLYADWGPIILDLQWILCNPVLYTW